VATSRRRILAFISKSVRLAVATAILALGFEAGQRPLAAQSAETASSHAEGSSRSPVLSAGDRIRLKVWRENDWSGEFDVNADGIAVIPRIGPVHVDGMSADALTRFLVDSLSVYLRNPSIEVTLLRRINVLGAVQKPDLYLVDASVTVADALALAGGASSDGKTDRVELRRKGKAIEVKLDKDTRLADTPMQSGDQLYVPQRGWISRNAGLVAAGLSAATTLVVALLVR